MNQDGKQERRRPEVKQRALDRMRTTGNISQLARDLGIPRRTLYAWQKQLEGKENKRQQKPKTHEQELEREVARLQQALGQATVDLDFFRGALQRIWDRRQGSSAAVESASTKKSES
jgi:hypothetical protein